MHSRSIYLFPELILKIIIYKEITNGRKIIMLFIFIAIMMILLAYFGMKGTGAL